MSEETVMFALSNIEVVCLQGLGVGLQLQRAEDDTIWNWTLFCHEHCIAFLEWFSKVALCPLCHHMNCSFVQT